MNRLSNLPPGVTDRQIEEAQGAPSYWLYRLTATYRDKVSFDSEEVVEFYYDDDSLVRDVALAVARRAQGRRFSIALSQELVEVSEFDCFLAMQDGRVL